MDPKTFNIDRPIMLTLLYGMLTSMVLLIVGLIILFLHPQSHTPHSPSLSNILIQLKQMQASGWLSLGLFILLLTPVARVLMAAISFVYIKDWKYVVISTAVLAAMMVGLFSRKG